jgi:hypothetical protein
MKKIVLLGLVAGLALLTAGCAMFGYEQRSFEGKWQNFYAPFDLIYEFKENTWKLTVDKTIYRGAFAFDDSHIIFVFIDGKYKETWQQEYSFGDNTLNLKTPDPQNGWRVGHMYGPFTRQ